MKVIYSILFYLALPLILMRLIWRSFKAPDYFKRWNERFGCIPSRSSKQNLIWVHAVSVGEVEACRPLIKGLQERYPEHQILITTMTPTGSARVKTLFADAMLHVYLPYDMPFAIKHFLDAMQPQFGIIMETELWPNLLLICAERSIPVVIANARLSARSARGYQKVSNFTRQMLENVPLIAAQTQSDRERFVQLGALKNKVHAVGNLKYEISLPASVLERAESIRALWGNRPSFIAASTHDGEEELILDAARTIRSQFRDLLLIIVPRHPERFDRVAALCRRSGLNTLRRSEGKPCGNQVQALVIDTMGELSVFYGTADVAFVGGSLVNHGGHNILEPAALSRPVITGPHYFNFLEVTRQFLEHHAAIEVKNPEQLADSVIELLKDPQRRAEMGDAGKLLIEQSKGASQRLLNLIDVHISHVQR
ncbi:lipid IV(A) 3-deoxy-D-manno-octulosonic acid transferase [Methylophaga nitratireducenticrescens]|uniref:3-deoxy-D-manno-octulosonic acid transferase n=1 Tax=Methylophaga nitratireducenticrescens TaxID=754476 RepID=I1XGS5_METNJ|nr:3-deoxy-D-manno-octulosonic acid transferase [Methylophaga nitratireducenticrescens]AUZ83652.1 3-deoxy-D-manno-octulosonic acid transferase [Methylophaga nitratireducenticrescens]